MLGANAEKLLKPGDVIRLRALHASEWPESETGWIWARCGTDTAGLMVIDIVAIPESIFTPIKDIWCEVGTWITSIDDRDEVRRFHPDKVPAKFWGYLAYRELTGSAQAI